LTDRPVAGPGPDAGRREAAAGGRQGTVYGREEQHRRSLASTGQRGREEPLGTRLEEDDGRSSRHQTTDPGDGAEQIVRRTRLEDPGRSGALRRPRSGELRSRSIELDRRPADRDDAQRNAANLDLTATLANDAGASETGFLD